MLGVTLLAGITVWGQSVAARRVTIQVRDQSGAPVAHAQIKLAPAPDAAPAKMETDDKGSVSLNLKAGSYAVVVTEQGFKNWSESIYVAKPDGEDNATQVYPVVLQLGATGSPAVYAADTLVLSANAYHAPVALSPEDFRALPHINLTVHNGHSNADETYSGVSLTTLLDKVNAPLSKELQKEELTSYVVATGSDGYSVVLSLAEVDPKFHGGQVIVADSRNGQPLGKSGPFELIVSEDKRPARWVHNLDSIELQGVR
jgi:hypothetical protein